MTAKPPSSVQVALLFDRHEPIDLAVFASRFKQAREGDGETYNIVELIGDGFLRLFGANERMITIEQGAGRLKDAVFERTSGSAYTRLTAPEAGGAIAAHTSYTLIEVSHGAVPDVPEIAHLLAKLDMADTVGQPEKFVDRLTMAETLAQACIELRRPSLVHWTQSDTLMPPETFVRYAGDGAPSLLHVHPFLGGHVDAAGAEHVGFCTLGAEHFIGREVIVTPAPVPAGALIQFAMAFIRMAHSPDHYVIPHGETFGPSGEEQMAVRHLPGMAEDGRRFFELTLLRSAEHDYICPAEAVPDPTETSDSDGVDLDPNDPFDRAIMERLAERAGGAINARPIPEGPVDGRMASPNRLGMRMVRRGFGRRRAP